jgi:hypothetical protein
MQIKLKFSGFPNSATIHGKKTYYSVVRAQFFLLDSSATKITFNFLSSQSKQKGAKTLIIRNNTIGRAGT